MRTFVIAEIGINHNGDLDTAKKLIDLAKSAGCDAVKFQMRTVDKVYTKEFLDSPRESSWGTTQRAQKEGLEFGRYEYSRINSYCDIIGIDWFASAWDLESQKFLQEFHVKHNKIASAMLTYVPLLEMVAKERKHTFISIGMSSIFEIDQAVQIFQDNDCPYTLMHCVSTYPMAPEDANLDKMTALVERYGDPVGYSGHEVGLAISIAAVAMGACALERHITLDRAMYGSDQAASVGPEGLRQLVGAVRKIEKAFGTGSFDINPKEFPIAKKLRAHFQGEN
jgi:N-acetylneuraminate synthase